MPGTSRGHAVGNAPAPSHLSADARGWWDRIVAQYSIDDDAGLLLLTVALESFDRMRGAQRIVKREGAVYRDRFGSPKAHPLLVVERDARAAMITSLKALNLDLEPLNDRPGRPGGSR